MAGTPGPKILQAMLQSTAFPKSYGAGWFNKLKVVSSGNGQCRIAMRVEEEHLNRGGTLHGGCMATMIDIASIMTVGADTPNAPIPAVSVDVNISYLKAAKLGDDLLVDTKMMKSGKTLVFVETQVSKKDDGSLVAVGTQTMARVPTATPQPPSEKTPE